MFDGLLGRGFAPKGKPLIKLTKNRIDVLRRKRTATIKFLKKDLADLVANGLDVNAYSRAGGLLDELRHLWNLEFVEQTCDFVYKNLSTMQKIAECPEDCREAVSSLMFAASRFSELPELRELRQMFHEKYADSLGLFVNQELVESMSSKPFSLEKKVKLMEDVALEFSIRWDSKAFEKRMVRHNSSSVKEKDNHRPPNMALPKRDEFGLSSKERFEGFDNAVGLNRKKADASERRDPLFQPDKESYANALRGSQHGLTSNERSENVGHASRSERKELYLQSKQEAPKERHGPIFNEGDTIVMKVKRENHVQGNGHRHEVIDAHKKIEVIASEKPSRERHEPIFNEGDTIVMKVKRENIVQGNVHGNGVVDAHKKIEVIASEKPKASSTKRADKLVIGFKQESFFQGYKKEKYEEHAPPKPSSKSKKEESIDPGARHHNDRESRENAVVVGESRKGGEYDPVKLGEEQERERGKSPLYKSLPPPPYVKPSGKARNKKAEASVYGKGEEGNYPDIDKNVPGVERGGDDDKDNPPMKRRSSRRKHIIQSSGGGDETRSRRRENSRKGLQVLIDEDEDSEEKMMDKLLLHYSKKPSSYEEMQESKSRRTHLKKAQGEEMLIHQPARSRSLPSEQWGGPSEPTKTYARAFSFQPEREAKHVHPKLPDYDDLAARFAELKGRS